MANDFEVKWSEEKNQRLVADRGIGFEAVAEAIEEGRVLDDVAHPDPNRGHQRMLIVEIENYACCVPYVKQGSMLFLKTVYRSRVFQEKYMRLK